jgi:hypothetical protein
VNVGIEFVKFETFKTLTFGQLDKDGSMVSWYRNDEKPKSNEFIYREWRYQFHDELKGETEKLLPDGRLIIYIQLTVKLDNSELISTAVQSRPLRKQQQPFENIYKDMVDQFVDIGGSVLLVFQDGEQQCHIFPLAARYNIFFTYILDKLCIGCEFEMA